MYKEVYGIMKHNTENDKFWYKREDGFRLSSKKYCLVERAMLNNGSEKNIKIHYSDNPDILLKIAKKACKRCLFDYINDRYFDTKDWNFSSIKYAGVLN